MADKKTPIDKKERARIVKTLREQTARKDGLGHLSKFSVSKWNALTGVIEAATPFGKFRQFLNGLAAQESDHPSYSKLARDTGLQRFELEFFRLQVEQAGIQIDWRD